MKWPVSDEICLINSLCNYSSFHWKDDSMIDYAIFGYYFQTNPSCCAVFVVLILVKDLQQVLENVAAKCYFTRYTNTISSGRLRHSLRCRHTFHFIVLPVDFCVGLWSINQSINQSINLSILNDFIIGVDAGKFAHGANQDCFSLISECRCCVRGKTDRCFMVRNAARRRKHDFYLLEATPNLYQQLFCPQ